MGILLRLRCKVSGNAKNRLCGPARFKGAEEDHKPGDGSLVILRGGEQELLSLPRLHGPERKKSVLKVPCTGEPSFRVSP